MNHFKFNLAFLVGVSVLSIMVRMPYLDDPMGRHHEWLTGHVLLVNSIYEEATPSEYYYAPVWNHSNATDTKLSSYKQFKDAKNNNYYVSYPPMAFILPYFVLKPFGGASVIGIRVLGIVNHILCAFLIFVIINQFFKQSLKKDICFAGFVGFSAYLFASGNLWFHTHVYFSDMQVHLFILSFIYLLLRYISGELHYKKAVLPLVVLSFLGAYTEWLAVFVSFFACILVFIKGIELKGKNVFGVATNKENLTTGKLAIKGKEVLLSLLIGIGTLLAIGLTLYQYSLISGWDDLYDTLFNKYMIRSGMDESNAEYGRSYNNSFSWLILSKHYEINYGKLMDYVWFSLLSLLPVLRFLVKNRKKYSAAFVILLLLLLSILTHHAAFFNFTTVHDFSTLKSSMLFSLLAGSSFGWVSVFLINKNWVSIKKIYHYGALIYLVVISYASVNAYYRTNHPQYLNHDLSSYGKIIKEHTSPEEMIACPATWSPELPYYAGRDVLQFNTSQDALAFLQRIKGVEKLAFVREKKKNVFTVSKYTREGVLISEREIKYEN